MYHHCTASEPKASATPIREKYAVSLLFRYGRMTSITSATHAQAVRINSGAINCRSEMLMIEVVLACRSNILFLSKTNHRLHRYNLWIVYFSARSAGAGAAIPGI